jgi:predicted dehydrogenase
MYKAGVIGCRGIGIAHATGIVSSDRAHLTAACDLDEETLGEFEQRWPDANLTLYRDHREMLARESLDIVTVATSDHRHADLVVDAANAGAKGIFCEKPLATSLADADRMIAACDANNTTLSVDHTRRFIPLWRHTKEEIVDQGVIGPVQYVIGTLSGPRAMLFRNGTHMCDTINWYAQGNPTAVYAVNEINFEDYGPRYASDGGHDPDTDPAVSILIEYDNDVRAFWNMCKPMPGVFDVDVFGSDGILRVTQERATLTTVNESRTLVTSDIPHTQYTQGHIAGAVVELIDLINNGGTPTCGPIEARQVMEVLLGALQSSAGGNVRVTMPIVDM